MKIRPILLAYNELPSADYVIPFHLALVGPNGADHFYEAYNIPLEWGPIERIAYSGLDYRFDINPWYNIYTFISPLLAVAESALVVAVDWHEDHTVAYGWGGNLLALVGKYAADRLLTTGSPEAVVDDFQAEGLIAHEVGHVLGYGHDTTKPTNVMYHWWMWPECYPSSAMLSHALISPARLASWMEASGCPKPPSENK